MTPLSDTQADSGVSPLGGQHNARIGLGGTRSPRVQTSRECVRKRSNTQMLAGSKWGDSGRQ